MVPVPGEAAAENDSDAVVKPTLCNCCDVMWLPPTQVKCTIIEITRQFPHGASPVTAPFRRSVTALLMIYATALSRAWETKTEEGRVQSDEMWAKSNKT